MDETVELPSGYVPGAVDHHEQWRWPHPYHTYAQLLRRGGGLAAVAEHECWGAPFGHCDGARLGFSESRFVSVQFSRVPVELLPIEVTR